MVGAYYVGPRYGRFTAEGTVCEMPGHSAALAALGTFILWFSWYGFNTVSGREFYQEMQVAALVATNTTLAAAAAGLSVLTVHVSLGNPVDIMPPLNGKQLMWVALAGQCAWDL